MSGARGMPESEAGDGVVIRRRCWGEIGEKALGPGGGFRVGGFIYPGLYSQDA